MLSSLNGKIAFEQKESNLAREKNHFTNDDDFKNMERLVSLTDCVFIGKESIECEENAFSVKHLRKNQKEIPWIIFSQSGKIKKDHNLWKPENKFPKILLTCTSFELSEKSQIQILKQENHYLQMIGNISGLFQYLKAQNIFSSTLLGGGVLNALFWKSRLVQQLHLTLSPFLYAKNDAPSLISSQEKFSQQLTLTGVTQKKDFLFLTYEKKREHHS